MRGLRIRLAKEEVDMFELMDQGQAFLQEMTDP